jgi:dTDP-4-dehydrorhamnose reductase
MVVAPIKTVNPEKILILGANGMLGHALRKVFPGALLRGHELDITDEEAVYACISDLAPEVVINAAGYTDVDGCEDHVGIASAVNGEGPGYIARACRDAGAVLVHYSTDYVFDGSRQAYVESDPPNPINAYGRSKLLGEQRIIQGMENYRIIRTSWLFGEHGKNFVDTLRDLSTRMDQVKVVHDQFGKPTYTVDLAEKTADLILCDPGIYHITNDGSCSWFEFAEAFIGNAVPCSSAEFPRKAVRPKYSVLNTTKTTPLRHWREALNDYLTGDMI